VRRTGTDGDGVVALVPMRHQSERVTGKNYRPLAGKPLYHYIIKTLTSCRRVGSIVVDTDSRIIRDGLARSYPEVQVIERPERLKSGRISMNEIIEYDMNKVGADIYLQTHCTNPFLQSKTIDKAIDEFISMSGENDSLFSVTRHQKRLWSYDGQPLLHNPDELLRTQDMPRIFEENSSIYIFTADSFMKRRNRIGKKPFLLEIGRMEAWDIDDEFDFTVAEHIMSERKHGL
jgi:CMP-N-acetylneuraminic acid synthetase